MKKKKYRWMIQRSPSGVNICVNFNINNALRDGCCGNGAYISFYEFKRDVESARAGNRGDLYLERNIDTMWTYIEKLTDSGWSCNLIDIAEG